MLRRFPHSRSQTLRPRRSPGHGVTLVYITVIMVALTGFISLGVDLARCQCAKTELLRTADAASRAASYALQNSGNAVTTAQAVALANAVDGHAMTLQSGDILTGNWSGTTFTAAGTPLNAVQVTATLAASRGTGVPLFFAQVFGKRTCDMSVRVIAKATTGSPNGFIGLNGVDFKNNASFNGYSSSTTTNPSSSNGKGSVGTNTTVGSGNGDVDDGDIVLGPSGSFSGMTLNGTQILRSTAIPTPADPTWSPTTNPNSIAQAYTVSSNTTLPGGTYWFTSLTINSNLTFSGPATVYVNGNVFVGGTVAPSSMIPSDLTIYQLGTSRTFGDPSGNGMDITANIYAPGSDFSAKNNLTIRGAGIFNSITVKNNATFWFDNAIGTAAGGVTVKSVK